MNACNKLVTVIGVVVVGGGQGRGLRLRQLPLERLLVVRVGGEVHGGRGLGVARLAHRRALRRSRHGRRAALHRDHLCHTKHITYN